MKKNENHVDNNTSPMRKQTCPAAKVVSWLLLISFVITILEPITGLMVHKPASMVFLILCIVHTIMYRKKLDWRKYVILAIVFAAFLTGMFGMILDTVPLVLVLHRVISIGSVFFLAIHIFVFHRRMFRS